MGKIDFVVTWVDNTDEKWYRKKEQYMPNNESEAGMSGEKAYRNWETFKYWFRGVEKFAPWVNKVYLVTDEQVPSWLDTTYKKVEVVDHKDIIDQKYLPVFNSNAIEMNLHKIQGLSENFVYFNDDLYLTSDVQPSDFFVNDFPVDMAVLSPIIPEKNGTANFQVNDMEIINSYFTKSEIVKNGRMLSLKYGKNLLRTLLQLPMKNMCGYFEPHLPLKFKKSTFETVWAKEPEVLQETIASRFREKTNINLWLFRYWQLASGNFFPRNTDHLGKLYSLDGDNTEIFEVLKKQKHKIMCINDGFEVNDFYRQKELLKESFEEILPNRSKFEKVGS